MAAALHPYLDVEMHIGVLAWDWPPLRIYPDR